MAAPYKLELTIASARDLKNINWRHGPLAPYAVVWVDPNAKSTTKVDNDGDTCPTWDETLVIPLFAPIEDSTLFIDIVQANAQFDVKPLIGSARLKLREVVDDAGIGKWVDRGLQLKRPSGRPHGRVDVKIIIRDNSYRAPDPYYAPPPYSSGSRSYTPYGSDPNPYPYSAPPSAPAYSGYSAPRPSGYPVQPPSGYPVPPSAGYGSGTPPPAGYPNQYDSAAVAAPLQEAKKGNKFGVGTGIAVGAVAGVLGGLALAGGASYVENKIEENVAERVENDLGVDDDYGNDDYRDDDY